MDGELDNIENIRREVERKAIRCLSFEVPWNDSGITEDIHMAYIKNFGETFKASMLEMIGEAFSEMPTVDELTFEVAAHAKFCIKRAEAFRGRASLVDDGMKYFYNENGGGKIFVVHGLSGSGKTSLMSTLAIKSKQYLTDVCGKKPFLVTRFCGTSPRSSTCRSLMESICQQLSHVYKQAIQINTTSFKSLAESFNQHLSLATETSPLILFIDSLDQLSDEDQARSKLLWLKEILPTHVYVVVSTLPDIGGCFNALKSKLIPKENFLQVEPLSTEETETMLKAWLHDAKRTLQEEQFECLLQIANDNSQEQPTALRLKLLFDVASKCTSYESFDELPASVEELIKNYLQSLEDYHGKVLVCHIFGILATTKHGLAESDLLDILSGVEEVLDSVFQYHEPPVRRLPQVVFTRLRSQLSDYMVESGVFGKSVLSWYHRQFREVAARRYLASCKEKYATIVADYFSGRLCQRFPGRNISPQPVFWKHKETGQVTFNMNKLSELPLVTLQSSSVHTVVDLLCDFQFIAAKIEAGLGRELMHDYYEALVVCKSQELEMFFRFVSAHIHLLEDHPQFIFQQALNMPRGNLVFEKVNRYLDQPSIVRPWCDTESNFNFVSLVNKPFGNDPCSMTLTEHEGEVTDLHFWGNNYLLSSSKDKKVLMLDVISGEDLLSISFKNEVHQIVPLDFSEDTKMSYQQIKTFRDGVDVICACKDGYMYIWRILITDSIFAELQISWKIHDIPFDKVTFALSAENRMLATGIYLKLGQKKYKGEARLWDLTPHFNDKMKEPALLHTRSVTDLTGFKIRDQYGVTSLAFVLNEFVVIGLGNEEYHGDGQFSVSVCSVRDMRPKWRRREENYCPDKLIVMEGDSDAKAAYILICARNAVSMLALFSEKEGSIVGKTLWEHLSENNSCASFVGPKGCLTIGQNDTVRIWGYPTVKIENPENWDAYKSKTPNEKFPKMKEISELTGHGAYLTTVAIGRHGTSNVEGNPADRDDSITDDDVQQNSFKDTLAASGAKNGEIKLWSLNHINEFKPAKGHSKGVYCCDVTADGSLGLSGGGKALKSWNAQTGDTIGSTKNYAHRFQSVKISPNGEVVCWRFEDALYVYFMSSEEFRKGNIDEKRKKFKIILKGSAVTEKLQSTLISGPDTLDFSLDGDYAGATIANSPITFIINLASKSLTALQGESGQIALGLRFFRHDADKLIIWYASTKSSQSHIAICNFHNKQQLWRISADGNTIEQSFGNASVRLGFSSATFAHKTRHLIACTFTGVIQTFAFDDTYENFQLIQEVKGHQGRITSSALSRDDTFFVTCSTDDWIHIWKTKDLTKHSSFYNGADVTCVSCFVNKNGDLVIFGGDSRGRIIVLNAKVTQ